MNIVGEFTLFAASIIFSLCSCQEFALNVSFSGDSLGDLFLYNSSQEDITVTVVDVSQDKDLELTESYFENEGHNSSLWSGELILHNTSWRLTWELEAANTSVLTWTTTLVRSQFAGTYLDIFPKEVFGLDVVLHSSVGELTYTGYLMDSRTEPILQWQLGSVFEGNPFARMSDFLVTNPPCSSPIQIVMPRSSTPSKLIYLGLSLNAFSDVMVWYERKAESFCGKITESMACSELKILDMVMTNHQLVFVSDRGIHVSGDLRSASPTLTVLPIQAAFFQMPVECATAMDFNLDYTRQCQHRQNDIISNDQLVLTYFCGEKLEQKGCVWSSENFLWWPTSLYSLYDANETDIVDATNHLHMDALIILTKDRAGSYFVDAVRLNKTDGKFKERKLFRSVQFGKDVKLNRIFVHPMTYFVYLYGNKIYSSEDIGYSFTELKSPSTAEYDNHVIQMKTENIVFMGRGKHFAYTKAGVPRVAVGETDRKFIMSPAGDLYDVMPDEREMMKRFINTTELIQNNTWSSSINPVAILPFGDRIAFLFEFSEGNDSSSTPFFSAGNIGQIFYLPNSDTELGLIADVTRISRNPQVLSKVELQLIQPAEFEAFNTRPELLSRLSIVLDANSTFKVVITLLDGDGWTNEDLYKSIIVLGYNSFLITAVVSATVVNAYACIPGQTSLEAKPKQWYLISLEQTLNSLSWYTLDMTCPYDIHYDDGAQTCEKVLDLHDTHTLRFYTPSFDTVFLDGSPVLYATVSNRDLMAISTDVVRTPMLYNISVQVAPKVLDSGSTAIIVRTAIQSLACEAAIKVVTIIAGCPCSKRLVFHYPIEVDRETFLYGDPRDEDGRSLVYTLYPNYRPPSELGRDIPKSANVYNADPSKGFQRNYYKISKESWFYKQCEGKNTAEECGCTDEHKYTTSIAFSDCKQRVYRMGHVGSFDLNLSLAQDNMPGKPLFSDYVVIIREVNRRPFVINYLCEEGECPLSQRINEDLDFTNLGNITSYNSSRVKISLNGSELFHFRVAVFPGISFCDLKTDIQIYIDREPIPYPLMFLLNFAVAIVMGGILFFAYLYYLSNHHTWRVRNTGPLCLDKEKITQDMARFPPRRHKDLM